MESLTMSENRETDIEDIIAKGIAKGIKQNKVDEAKAKGGNGFFTLIIIFLTFFGTGIITTIATMSFGMEKRGEFASSLAFWSAFIIYAGLVYLVCKIKKQNFDVSLGIMTVISGGLLAFLIQIPFTS